MEIMLDVMPLHLFSHKEALAARLRLDDVLVFGWEGTNNKKTHSTSHLRHWQDKLTEYLNLQTAETTE